MIQPVPIPTLGGLGAYGVTVSFLSSTTLAAGAPLLSMRYTSAANVFVLSSLKWTAITYTAFGAAQEVSQSLYIARSFSGSDSGGAAFVLSKKNGNMPAMAGFAAADMRISTGTALTAGTRTPDTNPIAQLQMWSSALGVSQQDDLTWERIGSVPPMLHNNEGLVIQNDVLFGATGVVKFRYTLAGYELPLAFVASNWG
jgi:hypothetical protein